MEFKQTETKAALSLIRDMRDQIEANNEFIREVKQSMDKGIELDEHFLVKEIRFRMANEFIKPAIEKLEKDIENQSFNF